MGQQPVDFPLSGTVTQFQQSTRLLPKAHPVGRVRGLRPCLFMRGVFGWKDRDQAGQRLPTVMVEMTGFNLEGLINNGDQVEIDRTDHWKGRGVLKTDTVRNLTGNATVCALGWTPTRRVARVIGRSLTILLVLVVVAVIIGVATAVVLGLMNHGS